MTTTVENTFTIKGVQADIRLEVRLEPRPSSSARGVSVATARWDDMTINGKNYGAGMAHISLVRQLFQPDTMSYSTVVMFDAGGTLTDAADDKLREGLAGILEEEYTAPSIADVDAALLREVHKQGYDNGYNFRKTAPMTLTSVMQNWKKVYRVITGSDSYISYADTVCGEIQPEVKQAYLTGVIDGSRDALEAI